MQDGHVTHTLLTPFIVPILAPPLSNFDRICINGFNIIIGTCSETSCVDHGTTALPVADYFIPPGNIRTVVNLISNPL